MGKRRQQRFRPTYIRAWRKERRLTGTQLAELAGLSGATISALESGKVGYSQDSLERIAEALNVTPGELLNRDPNDRAGLWAIASRLRHLSKERLAQISDLLVAISGSQTDTDTDQQA